MDLAALLATPEYSSLDINQAYDLLHRKRHVGEHRLTYLGLAARLGPNIARRLAETFDTVGAADALIAEIEHDLRGGSLGVDVGNALVRTMLDAWGANDALALTASDANAIKGLADNRVSDIEKYQLGEVRHRDIRWAKG